MTTQETSRYELGCRLPLEDWAWLNRTGAFERPDLRPFVSPFPPVELMQNVSGLQSERDFASHGVDIFTALTKASPRPLSEYEHILDFGCGCGRLARMLKGHPHAVSGCDLDARHIRWVGGHLGFMRATVSGVRPPLPYDAGTFDAIISISVFTHLNEPTQDAFLADLHRIARAGACLFVTAHGRRALERALAEEPIAQMLNVPPGSFETARDRLAADRHAFILQAGHLTNMKPQGLRSFLKRLIPGRGPILDDYYEYGITFVSEPYVREHWGRWFDVLDYRSGAIHDFQDIAVLAPKKKQGS